MIVLEDLNDSIIKGNLYVPDGTTSIRNSELSGSLDIVDVTLPTSCTIIDDEAFSYTTELKTLIAYGNISYIGNSAFSDSSVKRIEFKQNCNSVNDLAFNNCKQLEEIVCRDFANLNLGEKAFYYCEALKNITLSNSLQEIKRATFFKCKSLRNVSLPMSLTTLREYAFSGCESLGTIELPVTLKIIENNCFDSCKNLSYISIPAGVEILEGKVFNRCSNLQKVDLPRTLKLLDMSCFLDCTSLREILVDRNTVVTNQDMTPNIEVIQ